MTLELACFGRPGRMLSCPSPISPISRRCRAESPGQGGSAGRRIGAPRLRVDGGHGERGCVGEVEVAGNECRLEVLGEHGVDRVGDGQDRALGPRLREQRSDLYAAKWRGRQRGEGRRDSSGRCRAVQLGPAQRSCDFYEELLGNPPVGARSIGAADEVELSCRESSDMLAASPRSRFVTK